MPIVNAPLISGNPNLTDTLLKVTMAWESWQSTTPVLSGWHLLQGTELGLSAQQLANGVFANANAEAIVATATYKGLRTLAIGFRGTNDNEDWRHDFQNVNQHYELFAPLVSAITATVAKGEVDLVLVTGHSLGGAMTQMFMADYAGIAPAYALTTGAPGYLQEQALADPRIINYQVPDDPIVYLGANRALVGQTLSGPLGALLQGQLAAVLSSSFGIPPSLFTDSIPFMTSNYHGRGSNVLLQVPGHPAAPPSGLLALVSAYNPSAHEFPAYRSGIAATDGNPFDLEVGKRGGAGNDALFGTTGNDTIRGEAGSDILYLHVPHQQASIIVNANGLVSVASTASGTDTLVGVERLAFTDRRLAFDLGPEQAAGMTARLLGAAFDTPVLQAQPDWVGTGLQLFDGGMSLAEASALVVGLMGNPGNETFVSTVFHNVVGRAPVDAELQHFVGMLAGSGGSMTQAELLQLAAYTDENAANVGLVGLQTNGLEFS